MSWYINDGLWIKNHCNTEFKRYWLLIIGINGKLYRKSWKEFQKLKTLGQKYYCSNYYDVSVNKYRVKCGISWRSWENKSWINSIDPFSGNVDTG